MPVNDVDIELLETYLDDETSIADVNALRARLLVEPDLAAKLNDLRMARLIRKSVFTSMELPDDRAISLLKNIKDTARRDFFRNRVNTYSRYIGAAAACIVIGFTTGWLGRSGATPGQHMGFDPSTPTGSVYQTTPVSTNYDRPFSPSGGKFGGIPTTPGGGAFSVTVTDDEGHLIGVERFNTPAEAQRYAEEVKSWLNARKNGKSGVILPGAGEQF